MPYQHHDRTKVQCADACTVSPECMLLQPEYPGTRFPHNQVRLCSLRLCVQANRLDCCKTYRVRSGMPENQTCTVVTIDACKRGSQAVEASNNDRASIKTRDLIFGACLSGDVIVHAECKSQSWCQARSVLEKDAWQMPVQH